MRTSAWLVVLLASALACNDGDPSRARVFFTSPASPLHVRGGLVAMRIFVDGVPARVDLHKDGAPYANLGPNGPFELI